MTSPIRWAAPGSCSVRPARATATGEIEQSPGIDRHRGHHYHRSFRRLRPGTRPLFAALLNFLLDLDAAFMRLLAGRTFDPPVR